MRRSWLAVPPLAGLIAVLAAGAAAFALVEVNESESEAADEDRVTLLERSLDRRIAEMDTRVARTSEEMDRRLASTSAEIDKQERRLRAAGEESDVAKLDRRLRRVENDATDAVEAAADAGEGLVRVERRLAALRRDVRRLR